ncbi:hypothetical protein RDV89_02630 [Nocardioides zeae]|uniref:Uncharacterized protein n=1 Tax=Nocardioides imazamoxiresistens TaxID=3231893 RepID=A0ABU3PRW3_9ACTN|nr:hypothetical protein [Nocardioides zeae]MDT9591944.1 hypothetical protein [Nocardioides zeae]
MNRRRRLVAVLAVVLLAGTGLVVALSLGTPRAWDAAQSRAGVGTSSCPQASAVRFFGAGGEASAAITVTGGPPPRVATPPPATGVGRSSWGVSYGRDEPYAELDGRYPDLVYVRGDRGVRGYAVREDLVDIDELGGVIDLYLEDGHTERGQLTSPRGAGWPENERGQTYGRAATVHRMPDLVEVVGDCGVAGYVTSDEWATYSDAPLTTRALLLGEGRHVVEVVASDGTTVVDDLTLWSWE